MRNIVQYPIKVGEIVKYLSSLQQAVLAEDTVGDLRAAMLSLTIAIMEAQPELPSAWSLREPDAVDVAQAFHRREDTIEQLARVIIQEMKQAQPDMYYAMKWNDVIEAAVCGVASHPGGITDVALIRSVLQQRLVDPALGYTPFA